VWLTVDKKTLKDRRNLYEDRVLVRLAEILPADIKVCIPADRGFGDQKLYRMLTEELHFDYVIRFRGNITVTAALACPCEGGGRDAHGSGLGPPERTRAHAARRHGHRREI
jgi:hypothetical protein